MSEELDQPQGWWAWLVALGVAALGVLAAMVSLKGRGQVKQAKAATDATVAASQAAHTGAMEREVVEVEEAVEEVEAAREETDAVAEMDAQTPTAASERSDRLADLGNRRRRR